MLHHIRQGGVRINRLRLVDRLKPPFVGISPFMYGSEIVLNMTLYMHACVLSWVHTYDLMNIRRAVEESGNHEWLFYLIYIYIHIC